MEASQNDVGKYNQENGRPTFAENKVESKEQKFLWIYIVQN